MHAQEDANQKESFFAELVVIETLSLISYHLAMSGSVSDAISANSANRRLGQHIHRYS